MVSCYAYRLNNTCPDTIIINNAVHIRPPIARMTYMRDCSDKYSVNFEDRSIGATTWEWIFGDGISSTQQNPSHTYPAPGSYEVILNVTNGMCTHTTRQIINVLTRKLNLRLITIPSVRELQ